MEFLEIFLKLTFEFQVVFQNGRDVRSHKLTFNSARQLTSIKTSDKSNLFDAKYDSGLSVINALQYRVNPNKNSLEVKHTSVRCFRKMIKKIKVD